MDLLKRATTRWSNFVNTLVSSLRPVLSLSRCWYSFSERNTSNLLLFQNYGTLSTFPLVQVTDLWCFSVSLFMFWILSCPATDVFLCDWFEIQNGGRLLPALGSAVSIHCPPFPPFSRVWKNYREIKFQNCKLNHGENLSFNFQYSG